MSFPDKLEVGPIMLFQRTVLVRFSWDDEIREPQWVSIGLASVRRGTLPLLGTFYRIYNDGTYTNPQGRGWSGRWPYNEERVLNETSAEEVTEAANQAYLEFMPKLIRAIEDLPTTVEDGLDDGWETFHAMVGMTEELAAELEWWRGEREYPYFETGETWIHPRRLSVGLEAEGADYMWNERADGVAIVSLHVGQPAMLHYQCAIHRGGRQGDIHWIRRNNGYPVPYWQNYLPICRQCFSDVRELGGWTQFSSCDSCGMLVHNDQLAGYAGIDGRYCDPCAETHLQECSRCQNEWWDDTGDGRDDECEGCRVQVHFYSYTPPLYFHPPLPSEKHELYMGMEIEMELEYTVTTNVFLNDLRVLFGDRMRRGDSWFFYVKEDSSIEDGYELVTMPFNPEWGLKNINWEAFQAFLDQGYPGFPESCGQHLHISKASFTSPHLWKYLQLHHRLPSFCSMIGGREEVNNWGSFDFRFSEERQYVADFAKKKHADGWGPRRYAAVNLLPAETIELRYPTGTIVPSMLRKNIQWVQASYEFTKEISVKQIRNGILDEPNGLIGYIFDRQSKYPDLARYVEQEILFPKSPESYNQETN